MQVEMENLKLEYYLKLFQTFEILERKWIKDWNQNNQVGLSKSHIRILGILNDKGPQRPSKLADDLNITTGGITLLTKKCLMTVISSGQRAIGTAEWCSWKSALQAKTF